MNELGRRLAIGLAACMTLLPMRIAAADSPQQIFARSWEGKVVVLKQALYTLVYDERGKLGNTHSGRRDGLMVATPSSGAYLQFDGRQGKDAIVDKQPLRMFDTIKAAYMPDALDVRAYRKVEPIVIHRYTAGAQLVVSRVRVDKDVVRVAFAQSLTDEAETDPATWLTIKWPVPFNKSFSERALVEDLLQQFVEIKPAS